MEKLFCDPPSGWKYGFPKELPENRKEDLLKWLVEEGYPQKEIDAYGENFPCRFWLGEKDTELKPMDWAGGIAEILSEKNDYVKKEEDLTIGERLVGLNFNPSGDANVQRAKQLCADLTDILLENLYSKELSGLHTKIIDNALMQILSAQMMVVKALTFKDLK